MACTMAHSCKGDLGFPPIELLLSGEAVMCCESITNQQASLEARPWGALCHSRQWSAAFHLLLQFAPDNNPSPSHGTGHFDGIDKRSQRALT